MVDLSDPQTQVLLFVPLGAIMLYFLVKDEPAAEETQTVTLAPNGKEAAFLRFNQDGIYGNLLATEEHFRNISADANFNQCAVKHLSLSANHASEAVSHTVAVGDVKDSKEYAKLNTQILELQHDVQDGKVTPAKGIERVREIKHEFEVFNPAFNVSLCKACTING